MRAPASLASILLVAPAALPAPLPPGAPALSLRLEGVFGQPTSRLGARGGLGVGAGWRLGDQLSVVGDVAQRVAPGGGITSIAAGLQATLDATPVSPYLEIALVETLPRRTVGYSLATRTGFGADWHVGRGISLGLVVRTLTPFDPESDVSTVTGLEGALRLIFVPGGK